MIAAQAQAAPNAQTLGDAASKRRSLVHFICKLLFTTVAQ
jgi:hypothetical protein